MSHAAEKKKTSSNVMCTLAMNMAITLLKLSRPRIKKVSGATVSLIHFYDCHECLIKIADRRKYKTHSDNNHSARNVFLLLLRAASILFSTVSETISTPFVLLHYISSPGCTSVQLCSGSHLPDTCF